MTILSYSWRYDVAKCKTFLDDIVTPAVRIFFGPRLRTLQSS